ncbi:DUF4391 domain-containing protein [Gilvimarinus xylanilyticus]|uniref:DUF4391 domain-containing protein n=1 Tax=Gilvimarinus xylanilyticus TaxID=2944139 RepID=A0A9X2I2S9_9GAMM|nr:DUF4391 domain-containing protein [Gilvimarinus xylanilyticus]
MLFDYPKTTYFGRVLPKTKIYQYAKPKTALRQALVDEVDKIIWRHKLSPDTLNLPASRRVSEVQILELHPKGAEVSEAVLACIDKAISFPLIFEVRGARGRQVMAAIKSTAKVSESKLKAPAIYYQSDWLAADAPRQPLPVAVNLGGLYQQMLAPILPEPLQAGETLWQAAERFEQIAALERQIERLQGQLQRQVQFNRKVELNRELRTRQESLVALRAT